MFCLEPRPVAVKARSTDTEKEVLLMLSNIWSVVFTVAELLLMNVTSEAGIAATGLLAIKTLYPPQMLLCCNTKNRDAKFVFWPGDTTCLPLVSRRLA